MATWVVSPKKFLAPDDVHRLRRILGDSATLGRARGVQAAVRDQLIVELALGTGLRVSELSNLKVEDLFLMKGQNSFVRLIHLFTNPLNLQKEKQHDCISSPESRDNRPGRPGRYHPDGAGGRLGARPLREAPCRTRSFLGSLRSRPWKSIFPVCF